MPEGPPAARNYVAFPRASSRFGLSSSGLRQVALSSACVWLGLLGVMACSPAFVSPPRAAAVSASSESRSGFPEEPVGRLRSRSLDFPIELRLIAKPSWRISDGPQWLVASQPSSASELALRTWRADRLVRRADCEAQARLARPSLPLIRDDAVIERRPLPAPSGFDTELVVGVEPSSGGVSGYALAVGSSVGRCYAALFTTQARGPGAEQEVAARLVLVVDRVFGSVRLRSVEDRGTGMRRRLTTSPGATH